MMLYGILLNGPRPQNMIVYWCLYMCVWFELILTIVTIHGVSIYTLKTNTCPLDITSCMRGIYNNIQLFQGHNNLCTSLLIENMFKLIWNMIFICLFWSFLCYKNYNVIAFHGMISGSCNFNGTNSHNVFS